MKDYYTRLKAALLAGTIALSGVGLSGCGSNQNNAVAGGPIIMERQTVKTFLPGEHIISKPINADIRNAVYQYDYIPGYEPIGISVSGFGSLGDTFGGTTIIYQNTDIVTCSSNATDVDGQNLYLDFGTPIDGSYVTQEVDGEKEFAPGEHIISVPLDTDVRSDSYQYTPIDGYEIVGIATSAYGSFSNLYGGGALLYKNVIPVKCSADERGYTSFGTPIVSERENTLY